MLHLCSNRKIRSFGNLTFSYSISPEGPTLTSPSRCESAPLGHRLGEQTIHQVLASLASLSLQSLAFPIEEEVRVSFLLFCVFPLSPFFCKNLLLLKVTYLHPGSATEMVALPFADNVHVRVRRVCRWTFQKSNVTISIGAPRTRSCGPTLPSSCISTMRLFETPTHLLLASPSTAQPSSSTGESCQKLKSTPHERGSARDRY